MNTLKIFIEDQKRRAGAKSAVQPIVMPGGVSDDGKGWRREWPDEPGWWWFHGRLWVKDPNMQVKKYESVEVIKTANGFAVITKGAFLYKSENHDGWWIKANVPAPPEV